MSDLDDLLRAMVERLGKVEDRLGELNLLEIPIAAGGYPALSGLTAGQVLRATAASAAAFGTLDLANANATTGALPHGRGGTGLTATPSNGQLAIGNGAGYALAALTGTANRVVVTNGAGTITLSGPQDLATGSSPTFAALTVSALTAGRVALAGASGLLADDADLAFNGTRLALATQGSTGGVLIGGDALLYRSAADILRTPDSLTVDAVLTATGGVVFGGVVSKGNYAMREIEVAALTTGTDLALGAVRGLVIVVDASGDGVAAVVVRGASSTPVLLNSVNLTLVLGATTGTTLAMHWASSQWNIRNNFGSNRAVRVISFDA